MLPLREMPDDAASGPWIGRHVLVTEDEIDFEGRVVASESSVSGFRHLVRFTHLDEPDGWYNGCDVRLAPLDIRRWLSRIQEVRAAAGGSCGPPRTPGPTRLSATLLLGSAKHAADVRSLQRLGVTAVCNCAATDCPVPEDAYRAAGLAWHAIHAEDSLLYPLLERHLAEAMSFYTEQRAGGAAAGEGEDGDEGEVGGGGCVLIHCMEGTNRSACLAVALLLLCEGCTPLLKAMQLVCARRPGVLSNSKLSEQLVQVAAERGVLQ